MKEAISILKSEHRSISAVLHALKEARAHGARCHRAAALPGARSMVRYIDEYPEKLHHLGGDEHLFARLLRARRRAASWSRRCRPSTRRARA